MKSSIMFISALILVVSCNSVRDNKNITKLSPVYQSPDSIFLPGGFMVGQSEAEIKSIIKGSPNQYYFNRSELLKTLHLKLCDHEYMVFINLYKGALHSVLYIGSSDWSDLDDPELLAHYKEIRMMLSNLNRYYEVDDYFKRRFEVEWPYSVGYKSSVQMAKYHIDQNMFENYFTVSVAEDGDFKYRIDINYDGSNKGEYESGLSKSLDFD